MNRRITTLDEVRQLPYARSKIAATTQQCALNLTNNRRDILKAVEEYLDDGGVESPIAEITGLLSRYMYVCGFVEELANTTKTELKEIAKEAENYLPTFQGLRDTTYAINALFNFLTAIGSYQERSDRNESQLQLIQDIALQAINKTSHE